MSKKLNIGLMSYDELEEHYRPLIEKFVRKVYYINGYDSDDLRQEFREVLHKAHTMYDATRRTKFITYLYTAFKNKLQNIWRDHGGTERNDSPLEDAFHLSTKDDTSFVDTVGLTSPKTQKLAAMLILDIDYEKLMPKQEIDQSLAELYSVLKERRTSSQNE